MSAITGALIGAIVMAVLSVPINYYLTYPVYAAFIPMDTIIGMYQAINPSVTGLLDALIKFNMPFTFVKALFSVLITVLIYKHVSPLIKGTKID